MPASSTLSRGERGIIAGGLRCMPGRIQTRGMGLHLVVSSYPYVSLEMCSGLQYALSPLSKHAMGTSTSNSESLSTHHLRRANCRAVQTSRGRTKRNSIPPTTHPLFTIASLHILHCGRQTASRSQTEVSEKTLGSASNQQ